MKMNKMYLEGGVLYYELQRKNVKNINLRIRPDGTVYVSAHKRVPQKVIEDFILSKAPFIQKARERCQSARAVPQTQYFAEDEIRRVITALCKKVYPHFEKRGVPYPQIKFRRMVSRWGSCHPARGILTFNTNLMYAPPACIEYVVWHEFTHFLQANHSGGFYEELSAVCPDWKARRKRLREIHLR